MPALKFTVILIAMVKKIKGYISADPEIFHIPVLK